MIRQRARAVAADILTRTEQGSAYTNILLSELSKGKTLRPEEFPVVQRMVRGVLERRDSIDGVLAEFLRNGGDGTPDLIRNILRIGVYQLRYLDRVPSHLIVNESVDVVKRGKFGRLSGLVNGVLRGVVRGIEAGTISKASPDSEDAEGGVEELDHPQWMIRRWTREFGSEETVALCRANNTEWPVFLRVNTLRFSAEEVVSMLAKDKVDCELSKDATGCIKVKRLPRTVRIQKLEAYVRGAFFVQDASSALVTEVMMPKAGEEIVDLCSAPGGKTCSLALLSGGKAHVVAGEVNPSRLQQVRSNCERLGLPGIEYYSGDGCAFAPGRSFDGVLVDVPCSGLGVLGRRSDARWSKHESDITNLFDLQRELLRNAARLVRSGGRVVYSTCTIEVAENEDVIKDFLLEHPQFRIGKLVQIPERFITPDGFLRTWPHRHGIAGAFAALLECQA